METLTDIINNRFSGIPMETKIDKPNFQLIQKEPRLIFKNGILTMTKDQPTKINPIIKSTNSMSFRKPSQKTKIWTNQETLKFYDCLSVFGTDFSLIALCFSNRTRQQIKKKFTKESRINSTKVDNALLVKDPSKYDLVHSYVYFKPELV
jgi:hypothetical protein